MRSILFSNRVEDHYASLGLLVMRVMIGGMMLVKHGWPKLSNFAERMHTFSDPLGVGSTTSLLLATGAEVFAAIALMIGVATRLFSIPLVINMAVIVLIVHAGSAWPKIEFALLYLVPFFTLMLVIYNTVHGRLYFPPHT